MTAKPHPNQRKVIRSVALPAEHGGWGFLIEPILLGSLAAFSAGGFLLSVSAVGVFLLHQPLKLVIKDRLKANRLPRTIWAERFAIGYATLAIIPLVILILARYDLASFFPLLIALPFALIQLWYDAQNQSRKLLPELSGAMALSTIAPILVLLNHWDVISALALWLFLLGRIIPSIVYVRARLRLERDDTIQRGKVWILHIGALGMVGVLALSGILSYLGVLAMAILSVRAVIGLSDYRKPRRAPIIGFQEIGYGLLTAVLGGIGHRFGI